MDRVVFYFLDIFVKGDLYLVFYEDFFIIIDVDIMLRLFLVGFSVFFFFRGCIYYFKLEVRGI